MFEASKKQGGHDVSVMWYEEDDVLASVIQKRVYVYEDVV